MGDTADSTADLTTDVLVVGAGPCGVTLANLLGTYGTTAIVVDREADIIDYPRAVGIDDESLRSCQAVGLADEVIGHTLQNMPIRYFTSWGFNVVAVTDRLAGNLVTLGGSTNWQWPTLSSNGRYVAVLSSFSGGALMVIPNPL